MYCNYVINVIVIGNRAWKHLSMCSRNHGPFPPPQLEISRSDFGRMHVSDEIILGQRHGNSRYVYYN